MTARRILRTLVLGATLVAPLALVGVAQADEGPSHDGNPKEWGPPLAALCSSPAAAAAAGYNVILGNNAPNVINGGPGPDAIFAFGGNDIVNGGPGPDLLCLGQGDDRGNGGGGNDAVFGEQQNDLLRGVRGRDYLDGGTQNDKCDGGPQADVANACEVVINVP